MSKRETTPAAERRTPWRALRWLPASHSEVWAVAIAIWLLVAMINAAIGWPMIRTLAPAMLLAVVAVAESHRLRRRTQTTPAQD
ncbi:MAG TPA: hypothetical protein VGG16_09895 [Streptosporangiaceae bacterium]|jgi:hypothetical protein